MGRTAPLGGDIAQRQPDQLGRSIVGGKVTQGLDDLAQLHVDVLNGVGRLNNLAYAW